MKNLKTGIKRKHVERKRLSPPDEFKGREYVHAVGRRKEATAFVRVYRAGKGRIFVNNKPFDAYFTTPEAREIVKAPLAAVGKADSVDVVAMASGGGMAGQADSVRLGIARALLQLDPQSRTNLKKAGYLTRDARVKERKKPGLKKARRAPQWAKR